MVTLDMTMTPVGSLTSPATARHPDKGVMSDTRCPISSAENSFARRVPGACLAPVWNIPPYATVSNRRRCSYLHRGRALDNGLPLGHSPALNPDGSWAMWKAVSSCGTGCPSWISCGDLARMAYQAYSHARTRLDRGQGCQYVAAMSTTDTVMAVDPNQPRAVRRE